jgi:tetratricopeptide (TPR) repeat protein
MSDKMTKKELRTPDEFQKIGAQAVPLLVQHQKALVRLIGAVVVVGLGIFMVQYFGQRSEAKTLFGLAEALRPMSAEVNVNAVVDPKNPRPVFKTEAEKNAALVQSLTEFRSKSNGLAAATASLPLAHALLREGKADEALGAFDAYLKGAPTNDPLRPTAVEGRGYALEAKKDYDGALAAFEQLAKENTAEFMKGMGEYHRGRMLLLKGKTDEGVTVLQKTQADAPGTAAARMAGDRIALLVAKGLKLPEPAKPVALEAVPSAGDAGL